MNDYIKITEALKEYEDLYDEDAELALKKMIDLYPIASKIYNHEVCDAIDLWINESKDAKLVSYLMKKITENNFLNSKYHKWIELIER